ncbi:MAG TPA: valine--tRNA ligase [Terracidiphilus sp.]|jgi:valyl-tRNA synthetase|nr:valine--tRNA ligase [Terracidiphilus sp.]
MAHDLPKAYDPTAIEDRWAEYWVREKLFEQPTPQADEVAEARASQFSILLPPPNVTGRLHMGHMLNQTEMDILTRWRRMQGRRALWLPGTDHAGIATQMMVERQLAAEGTSREKLGRDAFVERVWEWKRHYGGAILDQMKRLGASVDWSREYFTMDGRLSVAVREAFVRLYDDGLIYRGAYIVNWCPRCQTAISDLEVVYDEHKGHLWEIRYPVHGDDGRETGEYLTIATTRPETMLGDVAVAVHPEDERYTHLHGKKLRLPLMDREIPVITDEWVSREFGTGAVKVTPAHDPNDFALGERHHLPSISVMDTTAHINENGGSYKGLDRFAARKKIVADLEELGLLAGIKDHVHNVGHCDRCKTVVEPRLSMQWFVKIQPLADKAIAAVKPDANGNKAIRFVPEMYEKTYLSWMENIHDWCISRQLWWGHRIPAWHCAACHKITVAREDPVACAHCGAGEIMQETDVLDTWFSSGLLPVSVFGWPNVTPETRADFDTFYPTSLLVTGFDILFFWVARMIMLGCWFAPDFAMPDSSPRPLSESVPFREVYIHALVRDANREKMSKTKGNVIDPIEIVGQYGTDAVRFTLASMASPGTDIAFNVARTEGYRAFANKIWNAARFIFMNVDRAAEVGISVDSSAIGQIPTVGANEPDLARWVWAEFHQTARKVDESLANYRYDDAANAIYQFFWSIFCDRYLEIAKLRLDFSDSADRGRTKATLTNLIQVFEATLRLLSPFMPFITEELWHAVYDGNPPAKSIALTSYPVVSGEQYDLIVDGAFSDGVQVRMQYSWDLISDVLSKRKERGVPEKELVPITVHAVPVARQAFTANVDVISKLARVSSIQYSESDLEGPDVFRFLSYYSGRIDYEHTIDVAAERERLTRDIAKYEKGLASADKQLGNPGFLAKAPAEIVEGLKKQEMETRLLLEKARAALASLPPE